MMVGSLADGGIDHGFIFHLEAFQACNPEVFPVTFPDLALLQLHG